MTSNHNQKAASFIPPGPFTIKNSAAGYVVSGPNGELHAVSQGWLAAEQDAARMNGAYRLGLSAGLPADLTAAIKEIAQVGYGNAAPDSEAVSVTLGELRRLARAAGLPATPARPEKKGRGGGKPAAPK